MTQITKQAGVDLIKTMQQIDKHREFIDVYSSIMQETKHKGEKVILRQMIELRQTKLNELQEKVKGIML